MVWGHSTLHAHLYAQKAGKDSFQLFSPGSFTPPLKIYFAPLLGLVDHTFQGLFEEFFAPLDRIYGPYFSPHQTQITPPKSRRPPFPYKADYIPQIMCSRWEEAEKIILFYLEQGVSRVNLNLGCPYPKLTRGQKGAALLSSPEKILKILEPWSRIPGAKVSIKIRLGWDTDCTMDLISCFKDIPGLDELIIHPRQAIDFYEGPLEEKSFENFFRAFGNKCVWSGEIWKKEEAWRIQSLFGKDLPLMLGRGLVADPLLAEKIKGKDHSSPLPDLYGFFKKLKENLNFGKLKEFSKLWERSLLPYPALLDSFRRSGSEEEGQEKWEQILGKIRALVQSSPKDG